MILLVAAVLVVAGRGAPEKPPQHEAEDSWDDFYQRSRPQSARTQIAPAPPTVIEGAAWVIDGDSIRIRQTQIRLFGIDAPELNHPLGKKAKWALHALCKGNIVRATVKEQDIHGRTVAICCLADGRDLSAEMVKLGLAIDWPKFSGGRYRSLETPDARRRLWLADARQKGRMDLWERFESGPDRRRS